MTRGKPPQGQRQASAINPAEPPDQRGIPQSFNAFVLVVARAVDRLGVPFTLLLLILLAVWVLGNQTTHNDFIRELLFGSVTQHPASAIRVCVALLALDTLADVSSRFRARRTESAEMKRIADEKTRLQQKILDTDLHHTETPHVRVEAQSSPESASVKALTANNGKPTPIDQAETSDQSRSAAKKESAK